MAKELFDLDRNDVEGAVEVASDLIKRGKYGPDTAQMLIMLQDDPEELIEKINELLEEEDR